MKNWGLKKRVLLKEKASYLKRYWTKSSTKVRQTNKFHTHLIEGDISKLTKYPYS